LNTPAEKRCLVLQSPTLGTLLALSPEEVVIKPAKLEAGGGGQGLVDVRVHFPRLGFVVRPTQQQQQQQRRIGGEAKL